MIIRVHRAEWRAGMAHGVLFGRDEKSRACYALLESYAVRHYQELLEQGVGVELNLPSNRVSLMTEVPA